MKSRGGLRKDACSTTMESCSEIQDEPSAQICCVTSSDYRMCWERGLAHLPRIAQHRQRELVKKQFPPVKVPKVYASSWVLLALLENDLLQRDVVQLIAPPDALFFDDLQLTQYSIGRCMEAIPVKQAFCHPQATICYGSHMRAHLIKATLRQLDQKSIPTSLEHSKSTQSAQCESSTDELRKTLHAGRSMKYVHSSTVSETEGNEEYDTDPEYSTAGGTLGCPENGHIRRHHLLKKSNTHLTWACRLLAQHHTGNANHFSRCYSTEKSLPLKCFRLTNQKTSETVLLQITGQFDLQVKIASTNAFKHRNARGTRRSDNGEIRISMLQNPWLFSSLMRGSSFTELFVLTQDEITQFLGMMLHRCHTENCPVNVPSDAHMKCHCTVRKGAYMSRCSIASACHGNAPACSSISRAAKPSAYQSIETRSSIFGKRRKSMLFENYRSFSRRSKLQRSLLNQFQIATSTENKGKILPKKDLNLRKRIRNRSCSYKPLKRKRACNEHLFKKLAYEQPRTRYSCCQKEMACPESMSWDFQRCRRKSRLKSTEKHAVIKWGYQHGLLKYTPPRYFKHSNYLHTLNASSRIGNPPGKPPDLATAPCLACKLISKARIAALLSNFLFGNPQNPRLIGTSFRRDVLRVLCKACQVHGSIQSKPPNHNFPNLSYSRLRKIPNLQSTLLDLQTSVVPTKPCRDFCEINMSALAPFCASQEPCISIEDYARRIMRYGKLEAHELVFPIMLISKAMEKFPFSILTPLTIHRLLLVGCVIISKFYSDSFFSNKAWSKIGGLGVAEFNRLERIFLQIIDYDVLTCLENYSAAHALIKLSNKMVFGKSIHCDVLLESVVRLQGRIAAIIHNPYSNLVLHSFKKQSFLTKFPKALIP